MANEPIKDEKELIGRLSAVRQSITELGMQYIQMNVPFKMDDLEELIEPLASIERTIDHSIEKLKERITRIRN
ncbi:MAG: hypothetical protein AAF634_05625 [Bacteroidota bacterium]